MYSGTSLLQTPLWPHKIKFLDVPSMYNSEMQLHGPGGKNDYWSMHIIINNIYASRYNVTLMPTNH